MSAFSAAVMLRGAGRRALGGNVAAARAIQNRFYTLPFPPARGQSESHHGIHTGGPSLAAESSYERDVTQMEGATSKVNLYDGHYSDHMKEAQTKVRLDTYGAEGDLGQSSWMSVAELDGMMAKLGVTATSNILEVGSGAGGTSVYVAQKYGCAITGVDLNPHGVATGMKLAEMEGVADKASFKVIDASKPLPYADGSFDAVFCNDSMCHIPGRQGVLEDWRRVLKPGGRMIFTDAMVVSGVVSSNEFETRSLVGKYYFPPIGHNERVIEAAGFSSVVTVDTTPEASTIAKAWHDSRQKYKAELQEPEENFAGLQAFLWSVHSLLHEGKLSRELYVATK